MAYYENITAGRGAIDSFANALNSQRFANLMLNETISNFSNNITRAGELYDEAKIKEEALKYQRMRDLANDKKQAEAFDLQKRQQVMNEEMHRQNKRLNDLEMQRSAQDIRMNERQFKWLMKATPSAKTSVSVDNNAMKTPTTPTTNALNMQGTPKPKTITKEEFKALYANPASFRF
ncbi:hypothetical protein KVJ87_07175 [Helicobacter pylori]|nr:hypothetical protein KVJ87_07175 [Helicobacter pylori]